MQKSVNIFPAIAKVGTWETDRLKSAFAYSVRGTGATAAVAATGTITITTNPAAGDTVTVGSTVYEFVSADPVGQQVLIGGTTAATATNLAAIIGGIATATASSNVVTVTASEAGAQGNSIALATSKSSAITVGASLTGGADYVAGDNATIGNAFTVVSKNPNIAIMGGTGKFAGILVNKGVMNFHVAAIFGAIGCVLGSIPSYYLGYFGGRPFVEKYGKYFLTRLRILIIFSNPTESGSAPVKNTRSVYPSPFISSCSISSNGTSP